MPSLSFLHLYGIGDHLPIIPEDLAADLKHINTVGLQRSLWEVVRVGSEITMIEWPPWKTKYCIAEDFQCEDDAWLFRYH